MKECVYAVCLVCLCTLSAGVCHADDGLLPAFRERNVPAERVSALRQGLPQTLDALKLALDREEEAVKSGLGPAPGTLQSERVAKRLEIARRLVKCIGDDLARGDVSSGRSCRRLRQARPFGSGS